MKECTDNAILCLKLLGLGSNIGSLVQTLSDENQAAVIGVIESVSAAHSTILKDSQPRMVCGLSDSGAYYTAPSSRLQCMNNAGGPHRRWQPIHSSNHNHYFR